MNRPAYFRLWLALSFAGGGILGALLAADAVARRNGVVSEALTAASWEALRRNQLDRAASISFDAIEKDPDSYVPYVQLGDVYTRRGENVAAREAYERSLAKLDGKGGNFQAQILSDSIRKTERLLIRAKRDKLTPNPVCKQGG